MNRIQVPKALSKLNSPIPTSVESECQKCASIIDHFVNPVTAKGTDKLIPPHIIRNAKGIAILTVIKAGFLFSGRAGGGLVVARLPDGSWSAPSAIASGGVGFGGQIGAELTDFVIILNTKQAVAAFSQGGNVTLGGNLSVAAGPFGRNAEAGGTVGNLAAIYSYSKTKGLFAGVSIEGSVIIERKETNATFYGRKVSAREILSGAVEKPAAASALYRALEKRSETPQMSPSSSYHHNSAGTTPTGFAAPPPAYTSSPISGQNNLSYSDPSKHTSPGSVGAGSQQQQRIFPSGPPPPIPSRPGMSPSTLTKVSALYDFPGERESDLPFRKGDIITVISRTDDVNDWWVGELNGRRGDFPGNFVKTEHEGK